MAVRDVVYLLLSPSSKSFAQMVPYALLPNFLFFLTLTLNPFFFLTPFAYPQALSQIQQALAYSSL